MKPLEYSEDLVLDLCRATNLTPAEVHESLVSAQSAVAGCMSSLLQAFRMSKELTVISDLMMAAKHLQASNGGWGKPNPVFTDFTSREGKTLREEYLKLQTAWRMTAKEIRTCYNQATWFAANVHDVDINLAKPADANDVDDPDAEEERTAANELIRRVRDVIAIPDEDKKREKKKARKTRKVVEATYKISEAKQDEVESAD